MLIKSKRMHIDAADNIPMAHKATFAAGPISVLGLVFMPTYRTLATCSSFRASEAHDVSLFGFMREVIDILAIFPQGHALVVVPSAITGTDPMGIADEEGPDFVFLTDIDHLSCGF